MNCFVVVFVIINYKDFSILLGRKTKDKFVVCAAFGFGIEFVAEPTVAGGESKARIYSCDACSFWRIYWGR